MKTDKRKHAALSAVLSTMIFMPGALGATAPPPPPPPPPPTRTPPPAPTPVPIPFPTTSDTQRDTTVDVPVFILPQNTVLPTDENQGMTGISLLDRHGFPLRFDKNGMLVLPPAGDTLPDDIAETPGPRHGHEGGLDVSGLPIVDTGEDDNGATLIPVAYVEASSPSHPANAEAPVVVRVSKDRSSLLVFNSEHQMLSGFTRSNSAGAIYGAPGTVVSNNKDCFTLHSGTLILESGSAPMKVATKSLGFKLEPHSAALVELKPFRPVSVMVLNGPQNALHLRTKNHPEKVANFNPGDVYFNGVCDDGEAWVTAKTREANDILHSKIHGGSPLRVFARGGTEFVASKEAPVTLITGSMFVSSERPSIVQTELGNVYALKPALFNVSYDSGDLRIESLSGNDSVTAVCGKQRIPMALGQEALITDHTPSRGEVLAGDGVGRRKFGVYTLSSGEVAVLNDYSIPMFLRSASNLTALRQPASRADKHTLSRAMKVAVACEMATWAHGGYQVVKAQEH